MVFWPLGMEGMANRVGGFEPFFHGDLELFPCFCEAVIGHVGFWTLRRELVLFPPRRKNAGVV